MRAIASITARLLSVGIVLAFMAFLFGLIESHNDGCHVSPQSLRTVCAPERLGK